MSTYNAHLLRFSTFIAPASIPATTNHVLCFVAHLFEQKYAPSSIASHLSAIAYAHKTLSVPDPTDHFLVRKLQSGAAKLAAKPDTRLPITPRILTELFFTIDRLNFSIYQRVLLKSCFTLAFFGLLRLGEISTTAGAKPTYVIQLSDIDLHQDHVLLTMHTYKHSQPNNPVSLRIASQHPPICPVASLRSFIALRGSLPGPLFCFPDLRPLSKSFLTSNLASILALAGFDPQRYKCHSFRIGAATYAATQGLSSTQIQNMGRWRSPAFQRYIRIDTLPTVSPTPTST